jgi:hypothetical protein
MSKCGQATESHPVISHFFVYHLAVTLPTPAANVGFQTRSKDITSKALNYTATSTQTSNTLPSVL